MPNPQISSLNIRYTDSSGTSHNETYDFASGGGIQNPLIISDVTSSAGYVYTNPSVILCNDEDPEESGGDFYGVQFSFNDKRLGDTDRDTANLYITGLGTESTQIEARVFVDHLQSGPGVFSTPTGETFWNALYAANNSTTVPTVAIQNRGTSGTALEIESGHVLVDDGNVTISKGTLDATPESSSNGAVVARSYSTNTQPAVQIPRGKLITNGNIESVATSSYTPSYVFRDEVPDEIENSNDGAKNAYVYYSTPTRSNAKAISLYRYPYGSSEIVIGEGLKGTTMISAGDAATVMKSYIESSAYTPYWKEDQSSQKENITPASKCLFMMSDNSIWFVTGMDTAKDYVPGTDTLTDWTDMSTIKLSRGGSFYPSITNKGSIGTSSYKWAAAYVNATYTDSITPSASVSSILTINGSVTSSNVTSNGFIKCAVYDNSGATAYAHQLQSDGNISLCKGSFYTTSASNVYTINTTNGTNISAGGAITATGNITSSTGNIVSTAGNITASAGTVTGSNVTANSTLRSNGSIIVYNGANKKAEIDNNGALDAASVSCRGNMTDEGWLKVYSYDDSGTTRYKFVFDGNGDATIYRNITAGGNITASGTLSIAGGNFTVNSSGDITNVGSIAFSNINASGSITAGTSLTATAGNITCNNSSYYFSGNFKVIGQGTQSSEIAFYPMITDSKYDSSTDVGQTLRVCSPSYRLYFKTGTGSVQGVTRLELGNATGSGSSENYKGSLVLYSSSTGSYTFSGATTTSDNTITIPDIGGATGYVALMNSNNVIRTYDGSTSGTIKPPDGGILPYSNGTGVLGNSSNRFSSGYITSLYSDTVQPATSSGSSLGTSSTRYASGYINTLISSGTYSSPSGNIGGRSSNGWYSEGAVSDFSVARLRLNYKQNYYQIIEPSNVNDSICDEKTIYTPPIISVRASNSRTSAQFLTRKTCIQDLPVTATSTSNYHLKYCHQGQILLYDDYSSSYRTTLTIDMSDYDGSNFWDRWSLIYVVFHDYSSTSSSGNYKYSAGVLVPLDRITAGYKNTSYGGYDGDTYSVGFGYSPNSYTPTTAVYGNEIQFTRTNSNSRPYDDLVITSYSDGPSQWYFKSISIYGIY